MTRTDDNQVKGPGDIHLTRGVDTDDVIEIDRAIAQLKADEEERRWRRKHKMPVDERVLRCCDGHLMEPKKYFQSYNGEGFNCDGPCGLNHRQTDFYHCSLCEYDLCLNCAGHVSKKNKNLVDLPASTPRKFNMPKGVGVGVEIDRSQQDNNAWDSWYPLSLAPRIITARPLLQLEDDSYITPTSNTTTANTTTAERMLQLSYLQDPPPQQLVSLVQNSHSASYSPVPTTYSPTSTSSPSLLPNYAPTSYDSSLNNKTMNPPPVSTDALHIYPVFVSPASYTTGKKLRLLASLPACLLLCLSSFRVGLSVYLLNELLDYENLRGIIYSSDMSLPRNHFNAATLPLLHCSLVECLVTIAACLTAMRHFLTAWAGEGTRGSSAILAIMQCALGFNFISLFYASEQLLWNGQGHNATGQSLSIKWTILLSDEVKTAAWSTYPSTVFVLLCWLTAAASARSHRVWEQEENELYLVEKRHAKMRRKQSEKTANSGQQQIRLGSNNNMDEEKVKTLALVALVLEERDEKNSKNSKAAVAIEDRDRSVVVPILGLCSFALHCTNAVIACRHVHTIMLAQGGENPTTSISTMNDLYHASNAATADLLFFSLLAAGPGLIVALRCLLSSPSPNPPPTTRPATGQQHPPPSPPPPPPPPPPQQTTSLYDTYGPYNGPYLYPYDGMQPDKQDLEAGKAVETYVQQAYPQPAPPVPALSTPPPSSSSPSEQAISSSSCYFLDPYYLSTSALLWVAVGMELLPVFLGVMQLYRKYSDPNAPELNRTNETLSYSACVLFLLQTLAALMLKATSSPAKVHPTDSSSTTVPRAPQKQTPKRNLLNSKEQERLLQMQQQQAQQQQQRQQQQQQPFHEPLSYIRVDGNVDTRMGEETPLLHPSLPPPPPPPLPPSAAAPLQPLFASKASVQKSENEAKKENEEQQKKETEEKKKKETEAKEEDSALPLAAPLILFALLFLGLALARLVLLCIELYELMRVEAKQDPARIRQQHFSALFALPFEMSTNRGNAASQLLRFSIALASMVGVGAAAAVICFVSTGWRFSHSISLWLYTTMTTTTTATAATVGEQKKTSSDEKEEGFDTKVQYQQIDASLPSSLVTACFLLETLALLVCLKDRQFGWGREGVVGSFLLNNPDVDAAHARQFPVVFLVLTAIALFFSLVLLLMLKQKKGKPGNLATIIPVSPPVTGLPLLPPPQQQQGGGGEGGRNNQQLQNPYITATAATQQQQQQQQLQRLQQQNEAGSNSYTAQQLRLPPLRHLPSLSSLPHPIDASIPFPPLIHNSVHQYSYQRQAAVREGLIKQELRPHSTLLDGPGPNLRQSSTSYSQLPFPLSLQQQQSQQQRSFQPSVIPIFPPIHSALVTQRQLQQLSAQQQITQRQLNHLIMLQTAAAASSAQQQQAFIGQRTAANSSHLYNSGLDAQNSTNNTHNTNTNINNANNNSLSTTSQIGGTHKNSTVPAPWQPDGQLVQLSREAPVIAPHPLNSQLSSLSHPPLQAGGKGAQDEVGSHPAPPSSILTAHALAAAQTVAPSSLPSSSAVLPVVPTTASPPVDAASTATTTPATGPGPGPVPPITFPPDASVATSVAINATPTVVVAAPTAPATVAAAPFPLPAVPAAMAVTPVIVPVAAPTEAVVVKKQSFWGKLKTDFFGHPKVKEEPKPAQPPLTSAALQPAAPSTATAPAATTTTATTTASVTLPIPSFADLHPSTSSVTPRPAAGQSPVSAAAPLITPVLPVPSLPSPSVPPVASATPMTTAAPKEAGFFSKIWGNKKKPAAAAPSATTPTTTTSTSTSTAQNNSSLPVQPAATSPTPVPTTTVPTTTASATVAENPKSASMFSKFFKKKETPAAAATTAQQPLPPSATTTMTPSTAAAMVSAGTALTSTSPTTTTSTTLSTAATSAAEPASTTVAAKAASITSTVPSASLAAVAQETKIVTEALTPLATKAIEPVPQAQAVAATATNTVNAANTAVTTATKTPLPPAIKPVVKFGEQSKSLLTQLPELK